MKPVLAFVLCPFLKHQPLFNIGSAANEEKSEWLTNGHEPYFQRYCDGF
jgi:hypothetical protein